MYQILITPTDLITANYLAGIRLLYEFQRDGYIYNKLSIVSEEINKFFNANLITTPSNIALGTLAELLVYKDLSQHLSNQILTQNATQESMIKQQFLYNLTIGAYDKGFDFAKANKTIDIKCYATKILNDPNEIYKFNLLVDKRQYENTKADLYIQNFIVKQANAIYLIVAGYAKFNDLILNTNFPKPAYYCSINSLRKYEELKQNYFQIK